MRFKWSDNPTISGSVKDPDLLNECLMHLKYDNNAASNLNIFDIKITDRILSEEESSGWALQGSLITKEYSEAVYKISQEYESSDNLQLYEKRKSLNLPVFTSNVSNDIQISDSRSDSTAYTLINGVGYKLIGNWPTYWFNINYNQNVYLKNYSIKADSNGNPEYPQDWELKASNDGEIWETIDNQINQSFALGETKNFNLNLNKTYRQFRIVFQRGISNNGELGKLSFNAEYIENSFTYKVAKNGHLLADISQKGAIDKYFEENGVADFYIFDKAKEQFYLPKNTWFFQFTTNLNLVNKFQEPGIPDHWHYVDDMPNTTNRPRGDDRTNCTTYYETKKTRLASECNPIYGNSESVQPPSALKLLYYYVGERTNYEN